MSTQRRTKHGHHDAEPDPQLESQLTPEQTQALEARVKALESLLIGKGLVSTDTLEKLASIYENDLGPMNGAKVVARAWVDPAYKQRLLTERSTARRVEALLLLLPVLASAAERALEVHRRAHTNGKGGTPTGLVAES